MIAVVRRLAPGVPFGDGIGLTTRMMGEDTAGTGRQGAVR
jgi:hypothetical protein